jgi:hypothetical protein
VPSAPPIPPAASSTTPPAGAAPESDIIRRPPPVLPSNFKQKKADDLTCARCGEINTSNRKFCARCGEPIEGGGEEPKKKTADRFGTGLTTSALLLRRVAPVVVVALTLLFVAVPSARGWINDRKESLIDVIDPPSVESVSAPRVQSSTEDGDHAAANVVDLNPLTHWQSSPTDQQATLTFDFGVPVKLHEAIIRNGALNADGDYRFFRRARQVVLVMQFADGKQKQREVTLRDSRIATISGTQVIDGQKISLDSGSPVARLQIVVSSTYDAPPDSPVALTEIEFFTERG